MKMKAKDTLKRRMSMGQLCSIGKRPNVLQIVPPRHVMRSPVLHDDDDHELVNNPLASPTGPGGAAGFSNRGGSQLAVPLVSNIYMGPFWGDRNFVEGFSKAIVENGYLDPLSELGYGTGPGKYQGPVNGPVLASGTQFHDTDAQSTVRSLLDQKK